VIWAAGITRFAVRPVVEGALVRFLVRAGEGAAVAKQVLGAVHALRACEFWPDSLSYAASDLGQVRGHRQVTDAYLVGLPRIAPTPDWRRWTKIWRRRIPTGRC
jgi:predicted nucleic acid-binding protein